MTACCTRPSRRRRGCRRRHLAHQDHGAAGHRRAPAAAGRPHQAGGARPGRRFPRLDHALAARRNRGAARARPQRGRVRLREARLAGGRIRRGMRAALELPNGIVLVTGPTGSGKTTTLYTGLLKLNTVDAQDRHRRGPDRISARRHQPDPGQAADRAEFRQPAALDPAAGPGRHHGRRNPRPRNRADRRAGGADRPSRALDAAHQLGRRDDHAAARHGAGGLSAHRRAARRAGAAAGAAAVPTAAVGGRSGGAGRALRPGALGAGGR